MNFLELLVQTPLATALGWALLHFIWQGTFIAFLLAGAFTSGLLRSPPVRYAAACAALGAMPLIFAATVWWSVPAGHRAVSDAIGHSRVAFAQTPGAALPMLWHQPWTNGVRWLAPSWISGVILLWMRACLAWLAAQRLRSTGVCAAPSDWQDKFERVRRQLRISQTVRLMESCLTQVPVVVGFFRPVVLLPVALLTGFPAEHVETFLIHELAHIRRYDYLLNMLQNAVEGLLFYHPAVWWVSGKVRSERENCCDDIVVEFTGDAPGYAVALTTLEEKRWVAADATLASNGGSLVKRIRRLLGHERPPAAAAPTIALLLVPACFALVMLAQERSPVQQLPRLYQLWLQEDVAYIITPREKAEFLGLQTEQQAQQFIAQFWERRDPTPGTPRNEYREEHYRRIGYANDYFGIDDTAGWRTDRGRIYIEFGPPDERTVYEKGGLNSERKQVTLPFERWRYGFIQGVGSNVNMEFVDRDRTGNFQMTMDPAGPDAGQRYVPLPPPR